MLTREHGIVVYDRQKARAHPDRLTGEQERRYVDLAAKMLNVYRLGQGKTRRELHRAIHNLLAQEEACPVRRIEAFCKLLDDASEYDRDRRQKAAALRRTVFRLAAPFHPLVHSHDRLFGNEELEVKRRIAAELGMTWEEIDRRLFADMMEFHPLKQFLGYESPQALVDRYNVAQLQVALYDAVHLRVWVTRDFLTVLRYAKLARLMHTITRLKPGEYRLDFDGPASVLRETRRYGVAMARFLPALLACDGWKLHATLKTRWRGWYARLALTAADGYRSHLPAPGEFDSTVEEKFAAKWGPEPRNGWTMIREGEILHQGQTVFVPDFTFRHEDGRSVALEIVGFWTPEYLRNKQETLRRFTDYPILVAASTAAGKQGIEFPPGTILFKTVLKVEQVLPRLEEWPSQKERQRQEPHAQADEGIDDSVEHSGEQHEQQDDHAVGFEAGQGGALSIGENPHENP